MSSQATQSDGEPASPSSTKQDLRRSPLHLIVNHQISNYLLVFIFSPPFHLPGLSVHATKLPGSSFPSSSAIAKPRQAPACAKIRGPANFQLNTLQSWTRYNQLTNLVHLKLSQKIATKTKLVYYRSFFSCPGQLNR